MKKILFMTDFYYPKPLANGICAHQISKELTKMGYDVHILGFNNKTKMNAIIYENMTVHHIRYRLFHILREFGEKNADKIYGKIIYTLSMLINRIKKITFIYRYPMTSPIFINRYRLMIEKLDQANNYDMLIATYGPLEAVVAGMKYKKDHKDKLFGLYFLDSLSNGGKKKFIPKNWKDNKGWIWEKELFESADIIYNMECHRAHFLDEKYKKYHNKMYFVDIPLLSNISDSKYDSPKLNKDIRFIYTGALNYESRNPEYLCEIFNDLSKNNRYVLDFYSRGNTERILANYERISNGKIKRHGYVQRDEAQRAMSGADVLISIGNSQSDLIPSKIFEYIALKKKIIHFYKRENDSAISYLKKYSNALLINELDRYEVNMNKIEAFIVIPIDDSAYLNIESVFIKNTPEYTAGLISEFLESKKESRE